MRAAEEQRPRETSDDCGHHRRAGASPLRSGPTLSKPGRVPVGDSASLARAERASENAACAGRRCVLLQCQ